MSDAQSRVRRIAPCGCYALRRHSKISDNLDTLNVSCTQPVRHLGLLILRQYLN